MTGVDSLHNVWLSREKAEFVGSATRGLKKQLKKKIQRVLAKHRVKGVSLKKFGILVMSAEIRKFDFPVHKSLILATKVRDYSRTLPKAPSIYSALTMSALEIRNPTRDDNKLSTMSTYRCGVCGVRNDPTSLCVQGKEEGV